MFVVDDLSSNILDIEQGIGIISNYIYQQWQSEWTLGKSAETYRTLVPDVKTSWSYTPQSRRQQIVLNQLRLQVYRTNSYNHKLNHQIPEECVHCGAAKETVEHLFYCLHQDSPATTLTLTYPSIHDYRSILGNPGAFAEYFVRRNRVI